MKTMRDSFLEKIYLEMKNNENIFLVSADFGSPVLDKIRKDFPKRFINVGIAEQNLINVSTGLALEGFTVFSYAIAPFITMRCFEQIRINLSMLSQLKDINVNLIGVGAGASYGVTGPSHHCFEDISIMNTLPNIEIFSPSDSMLAEEYVERCLKLKKVKYLRFDAKPFENIEKKVDSFNKGYRVLNKGEKIAIVLTGYMTQKFYKKLKEFNVSIIDLYFLNTFDEASLKKDLENVDVIITIEEGFINCGGMDSIFFNRFRDKKIVNIGFEKRYCFDIGDRDFILEKNNISFAKVIKILNENS